MKTSARVTTASMMQVRRPINRDGDRGGRALSAVSRAVHQGLLRLGDDCGRGDARPLPFGRTAHYPDARPDSRPKEEEAWARSRASLSWGAGAGRLPDGAGLARQGISVDRHRRRACGGSARRALRSISTPRWRSSTGSACSRRPRRSAIAIPVFAMRWPATGETVRTDMRDNPDPGQTITHNLHFGQHLLAELVMAHLLRFPHARMLWSHRLTALERDGDGVRLTVGTPDGETETARRLDCRIGRRAQHGEGASLASTSKGHTWPERFVATNIEYDFAAHGYADANMVVDPVDWAVIAKLGKGQSLAGHLWRGRRARRGGHPGAAAGALRPDPAGQRALSHRQFLALSRA